MSDTFLLSGSKNAMMQFQNVLNMIPKIKTPRQASEFQQDSIIQASLFIKKRLEQFSCD